MFTTGEVQSANKRRMVQAGAVLFYLNICTNLTIMVVLFRGSDYCAQRETPRFPRGHHECYASVAYAADRQTELMLGTAMLLLALARVCSTGLLVHRKLSAAGLHTTARRACLRAWQQLDVWYETRQSIDAGTTTYQLSVAKLLELFLDSMCAGVLQLFSLLRYGAGGDDWDSADGGGGGKWGEAEEAALLASVLCCLLSATAHLCLHLEQLPVSVFPTLKRGPPVHCCTRLSVLLFTFSDVALHLLFFGLLFVAYRSYAWLLVLAMAASRAAAALYLQNADWLRGATREEVQHRLRHGPPCRGFGPGGGWLAALPAVLLDCAPLLESVASKQLDSLLPTALSMRAFLAETVVLAWGCACLLPAGRVPDQVAGFRLGCACSNAVTPLEKCSGDDEGRPAEWTFATTAYDGRCVHGCVLCSSLQLQRAFSVRPGCTQQGGQVVGPLR
jgi:hypothetical protein